MCVWQDLNENEKKEQQKAKVPESKLNERLQVGVTNVYWVLSLWLIFLKVKIIVDVMIMWLKFGCNKFCFYSKRPCTKINFSCCFCFCQFQHILLMFCGHPVGFQLKNRRAWWEHLPGRVNCSASLLIRSSTIKSLDVRTFLKWHILHSIAVATRYLCAAYAL